jgi:DNA repair exonuclease SbcCD ATPase subunit
MMTLGLGCEVISPIQAQETLGTVREVRRVQEESIRPLLADLEELRQKEIAPREQELRDLVQQLRMLRQEKIQPLETWLDQPRREITASSVTQVDPQGRVRKPVDLEAGTQRTLDRYRRQEEKLLAEHQRRVRVNEERVKELHAHLRDTETRGEEAVQGLHERREEIRARLDRLGERTDEEAQSI